MQRVFTNDRLFQLEAAIETLTQDLIQDWYTIDALWFHEVRDPKRFDIRPGLSDSRPSSIRSTVQHQVRLELGKWRSLHRPLMRLLQVKSLREVRVT